jgi:hypothetical protein
MIGTGYHRKSEFDEEFAKLWYRNQREHAPFANRIAVISTGAPFPVSASEINVFYGQNLGHVGDQKPYQLQGWSASLMALCLLAYNCDDDLIYREQDVLAFGPWVEKAYEDMGDADMVFGHRQTTGPWMPCSQSIVIIRHRFLLEFVKRYIALGKDTLEFCPEHRFIALQEQEPARFRTLSFGVDRERPFDIKAPVWYAQQWKQEELLYLKDHNLI